jgi:L-cysteine:1D-myo-inositol 2-amino-2-deoxy-alpha-D-glucopyranoside ligase
MLLYNSLTRRKEAFTPRDKHVSLYVCGITPYDTTHLGHAFTYHAFDVLIRALEQARGLRVTYVQNVTDIDDDILRRAKQVGKEWRALGDEWTAHFIRDMQAINMRPPDHYPRASDAISEIVAIVEALIAQGVAYPSNGSVYFSVDKFEHFGALCGIPRGEMLAVANERGNRPDDPNKRDPLDFVLWQAQAPGEPAWDSPWGKGRPGWHIECTALNRKFLGDSVDIHGGGGDLIFPHHECEIAQAESASGVVPFVRVWMHVAMVRKDGEKMSKSLGNLVWVSELLKTYAPDAVRLYLASHHYRDSWEWNEDDMRNCAQMAAQWRQSGSAWLFPNARPVTDAATTRRIEMNAGLLVSEVMDALEDDLDTPRTIVALSKLAQWTDDATLPMQQRQNAQQALRMGAGLLGLRLGAPEEARVHDGWARHLLRFVSES